MTAGNVAGGLAVLRGIGGIGVAVAAVALLAVVNGGYVYRIKCPLASGGVQTSWTYGINDVLPYIRQTSAPCTSHTATRLALDALGIDKLHGSSPARASNEAAAASIGSALTAINAEFVRERTLVAHFIPKENTHTMTSADIAQFRSLLRAAASRLSGIRSRLLGTAPDATDTDIATSKRLLSTWIGYQIAADGLLFVAQSKQDYLNRSKPISRRLVATAAAFQSSILLVKAKYPEVKISPLSGS